MRTNAPLLLSRIVSVGLPVLLVGVLGASGAKCASAANFSTSRGGEAPSGIFSSMFGESKPRPAPRSGAQAPGYNSTNRSAAAERTKGLVPQFMSMFSSSPSKPPARSSSQTPSTSRVASASQASRTQPMARAGANPHPSRSTAMPPKPSGYASAAAAQSYRFPSAADGASAQSRSAAQSRSHMPRSNMPRPMAAATAQYDAPRSMPNRVTPASHSQPAMRPHEETETQPTLAAAALLEAHKLAQTANSESEFGEVFTTCRQVASGRATAEEIAFAKDLGSWALNRRGQIKAAAGNVEEALADFNTSVKLDPERWRAIHNRGVLLAQTGKFEQAFEDFQRTTKLNPEFAKAFSNRAALYTLAGDPEAALRDYQRAVELDPQLAVAQRGLGRTYHLLGMSREALEHLDAAVELTASDDSALVSRGDLLTDLGYFADAANDYERALAIDADSSDACRSSAWLLATCPDDAVRNPDLAIERARLAVQKERKADAETLNVLAAAHASAGDYQHAVQAIHQAISMAAPSERAIYEDRLEMYRQSRPLRIAPQGRVQQAHYER